LRTYIATGEDSGFTGSKTEEEQLQVKRHSYGRKHNFFKSNCHVGRRE
jgi:hypothetical protein